MNKYLLIITATILFAMTILTGCSELNDLSALKPKSEQINGAPTTDQNPDQQPLPGGQSQPGQPQQGHTPPPEAIEACSDCDIGSPCQFEAPLGTIMGTCQDIGGQCACVPEGGPGQQPGPNQPPGSDNSNTATSTPTPTTVADSTYVIVDTGQEKCYNNSREINCPQPDEAFYGQDAQYLGAQPSYRDNGDGTITDLNTGLIWQKDPGEKMTYSEAVSGAESFSLAGYDDWRLPTIKELYSLIVFSGTDPSGTTNISAIPFIDADYFNFEYGDTSTGDRIIDSQFVSSTRYLSTTMGGNATVFGVNFADGRIKGYPSEPMPGQSEGKGFFVLYVRGNPDYGKNYFVDNGDGTITDTATGLMWSQADSGKGMDWENALAWVQQKNEENYLGYNDWRLPNAKELESIVDYNRSPDATDSAAIDPMFEVTEITNEAGEKDYPFYWTGTTHVKSNGMGDSAAYVSFGRALGYWQNQWQDVHGAGAQRSDPKTGNPTDYPQGHGPQGDAIRILNYVRCVRDAN